MKISHLQAIIESISMSTELLIICSWCKRINVEKEKWQDFEKATASLNLFEEKKFPQLSHGMCGDCYMIMSAKFNEAV